MGKKHMGSTIDEFLKEEGIFGDAQAQAVNEVIAFQLANTMRKPKASKSRIAKFLKLNRARIDTLLRPR